MHRLPPISLAGVLIFAGCESEEQGVARAGNSTETPSRPHESEAELTALPSTDLGKILEQVLSASKYDWKLGEIEIPESALASLSVAEQARILKEASKQPGVYAGITLDAKMEDPLGSLMELGLPLAEIVERLALDAEARISDENAEALYKIAADQIEHELWYIRTFARYERQWSRLFDESERILEEMRDNGDLAATRRLGGETARYYNQAFNYLSPAVRHSDLLLEESAIGKSMALDRLGTRTRTTLNELEDWIEASEEYSGSTVFSSGTASTEDLRRQREQIANGNETLITLFRIKLHQESLAWRYHAFGFLSALREKWVEDFGVEAVRRYSNEQPEIRLTIPHLTAGDRDNLRQRYREVVDSYLVDGRVSEIEKGLQNLAADHNFFDTQPRMPVPLTPKDHSSIIQGFPSAYFPKPPTFENPDDYNKLNSFDAKSALVAMADSGYQDPEYAGIMRFRTRLETSILQVSDLAEQDPESGRKASPLVDASKVLLGQLASKGTGIMNVRHDGEFKQAVLVYEQERLDLQTGKRFEMRGNDNRVRDPYEAYR